MEHLRNRNVSKERTLKNTLCIGCGIKAVIAALLSDYPVRLLLTGGRGRKINEFR
jgi:hypothetical protein